MVGSTLKTPVLFWLGALLLPFALIAVLNTAMRDTPRVAAEYLHESATVIESPVASPAQLPRVGWRPVKLPGHAPVPAPKPSSGWYRIPFSATPAASGIWAVYIERPYSNYGVFINGIAVGESSPMTRPIPMHRAPLLFRFPAALLRPGENLLEVRSFEARFPAGLSALAIGPLPRIAPAYDFMHAFYATYKHVSVVVLLVLALLFAGLWSIRRQETAYAWFALSLVAWAAQVELLLKPESLFMSEPTSQHLPSAALGVFAFASAMFVNRYTGLRQPRVERVILVLLAAGIVVLFVDPLYFDMSMPMFVPYVWQPLLLAITVYCLAQLLRALRRRPSGDARLLAAAAWILLVVAMRDTLIETGVLRFGPLYFSYTIGFVLCAVAAVQLQRFARAFDAAERTRDELDLRVREKTAELEQNLVRVKDLEREQALSTERERIMQDMHDGLGGHLVQALAIATSQNTLQPMEEPLRACLEELRLMVDSLEPVNGDLGSVLGTLRARISRRLALAGVQMRWQVDDLPPMPDLGPRAVLDVARVVQEAITNAIKHSGCNEITVSAALAGGGQHVEVQVTDNGRGMGARGVGRGLTGMQRRAFDLGGSIEFESTAPGTRVTLRLPLARATNRSVSPGQAPVQAQPPAAEAAHS